MKSLAKLYARNPDNYELLEVVYYQNKPEISRIFAEGAAVFGKKKLTGGLGKMKKIIGIFQRISMCFGNNTVHPNPAAPAATTSQRREATPPAAPPQVVTNLSRAAAQSVKKNPFIPDVPPQHRNVIKDIPIDKIRTRSVARKVKPSASKSSDKINWKFIHNYMKTYDLDQYDDYYEELCELLYDDPSYETEDCWAPLFNKITSKIMTKAGLSSKEKYTLEMCIMRNICYSFYEFLNDQFDYYDLLEEESDYEERSTYRNYDRSVWDTDDPQSCLTTMHYDMYIDGYTEMFYTFSASGYYKQPRINVIYEKIFEAYYDSMFYNANPATLRQLLHLFWIREDAREQMANGNYQYFKSALPKEIVDGIYGIHGHPIPLQLRKKIKIKKSKSVGHLPTKIPDNKPDIV